MEITATPKQGSRIEAHLLLVRGWQNRFRLQAKAPVVGQVALGQGAYPWIASSAGTVFRAKAGTKPQNPLALADPANLLKLRVAAGAVAGMSLAPDMLEQVLVVRSEKSEGGPLTIHLAAKDKRNAALRLVMHSDGIRPDRVEFEVADLCGVAAFRAWQRNAPAPDALFDPPAGLPQREVNADDLHKIFSAMFNFAMESIE